MSLPGAVYAGLMRAAAPGLRLWLRRRVHKGKEIAARLPERFGIDATPRPGRTLIWLHAASVGETISILPVIDCLLASGSAVSVLVTTGTVTSARLLEQRGVKVAHRFLPLDVPAWVGRFLDHWRPDVAAFVDSELWPNLLAGCRRRAIPVVLLNARLSVRSAARWARLPSLSREILSGFHLILAQSEADAERLRQAGGRPVQALGNLKFAAPALPCDEAELARLRGMLGNRPVWLAASTHPGEEALIAAQHRALAPAHPGLLTIIVPRHPERGAALAERLLAPRRSLGALPGADTGLWIADTLGELGLFYRLAPIVFVGKSLLAPGGGQNPLEPARLGCAVAVGPFTGNFLQPLAVLEQAGGVARVADAGALGQFVAAMLRDPEARTRQGEAARQVADHNAALPALAAQALLAAAYGQTPCNQ